MSIFVDFVSGESERVVPQDPHLATEVPAAETQHAEPQPSHLARVGRRQGRAARLPGKGPQQTTGRQTQPRWPQRHQDPPFLLPPHR